MAKRITQETFDEVVRENIEDFEMELRQAIEDAANQFRSQGVDLSNIDMSGGVGKEELLAALETVAAFAAAEGADVQAFEQALLELGRLCADQHEFSARNKDVVQSKRGVHTLIDCLKKCEQNRTRAKVVEALRAVCRNHVGNRDLFEPDGMEALGSILQEQAEDLRLTTRVLRLIHTVCAKDENNKVGCMRQIGPELLVQLVGQRKSASVVRHSCLVMRAVTNPDDMRREASCAMENGRALVSRGAIPLLISVARESLERAVAGVTATGADAPAAEAESKQQDEGIPFDNETDGTKPTDVASAAFLALRQLAITSESVNLISAHGGLDLPKLILDSDIDDGLTIRAVIGLVRNICADDKYKTTLCQDGTLHSILRATVAKFDDATAVEHAIATMAAMALRSPSNVQTIVGLGGIDFIVNGMSKHPSSAAIQRQAALCIRNMVGRTPELREPFLDAGAERLLREAGKNPSVVDESYAALRELQCEVAMVKVTEDGVVMPAVESFGQRPLQFNPVFDETHELNARIQTAAKPPGSNF